MKITTPRGAMAAEPARRIETRRLSDLKPHTHQDELFHPMSRAELARLAEDIRRHGLLQPVEVTPDGRIIDGHQRVRAARKLGRAEITVWVREDLAGDERAVDRRHIEANLHRRQLAPLDRVRLARRMLEIERGCRFGVLVPHEEGELRDRVGEVLHMSGRNAQRYLNIGAAPMEVQRAYSEGRLPMALAARVHALGVREQAMIATAIRGGSDPAKVILAKLPRRKPKAADPGKALVKLVAALEVAMAAIEGREAEFRLVSRVRNPVHKLALWSAAR